MMSRNSAWFLCTVLLCFGQILAQDNHNVKAPSSVPVEPSENPVGKPVISHSIVDHHEVEKENPTGAPSAKVSSHDDANIPKTPPSNQDKPTANLPSNKPIPTTSTAAVPTSTSTHKPEPLPTSTHKPEPLPTSTHKPEPSSTSTPKPTIPPAPSTSTPIPVTPKPVPQKGSWNVTNKNITCLRIDGIFSVDYSDRFNKTTETVHYDVPKSASSHGKCSSNIDEITLYWSVYNSTASNNLTFIFEKNGTEYVLKSFKGSVYLPKKQKQQGFNTSNNQTHFSTPIGQSYSCSSMKQVAVDPHTKVVLDQFQFQAFKNSSGAGFDTSKDCQEAPHTADIVPIVVGCVLALLVIAVLVAYLISRRRSQTRGYLSM